MKKIVTIPIEFCNSRCPHFYHKYEDGENCWCIKLDKRIAEPGDGVNVWMDFTERAFPEECQLPDT